MGEPQQQAPAAAPVLCRPVEAPAMLARFAAGVARARAIRRAGATRSERRAARDAAIARRVARGLSVREIAGDLRMASDAVRKVCHRMGLSPRRERAHPGDLAALRARLAALVAQGLCVSEIARAVGRDRTTVRYHCARFGLEPVDGRHRRSRRRVAA